MMECWNTGSKYISYLVPYLLCNAIKSIIFNMLSLLIPLSHYSIIPLFHYSYLPLFLSSTIPITSPDSFPTSGRVKDPP